MKDRKPRLTVDGLPIDARDWLVQDWIDLHEAIEKVKRNVARHGTSVLLPASANILTTKEHSDNA